METMLAMRPTCDSHDASNPVEQGSGGRDTAYSSSATEIRFFDPTFSPARLMAVYTRE